MIIYLHSLFDCFVDFVFGMYYDHKAKRVPPVKNNLLLESAVSLAEKIRLNYYQLINIICCLYVTKCILYYTFLRLNLNIQLYKEIYLFIYLNMYLHLILEQRKFHQRKL
jgi:hypothetical protein